MKTRAIKYKQNNGILCNKFNKMTEKKKFLENFLVFKIHNPRAVYLILKSDQNKYLN